LEQGHFLLLQVAHRFMDLKLPPILAVCVSLRCPCNV